MSVLTGWLEGSGSREEEYKSRRRDVRGEMKRRNKKREIRKERKRKEEKPMPGKRMHDDKRERKEKENDSRGNGKVKREAMGKK